MPIFLCYDPEKRTTPWTQEKYRSMTNEFTKRRIKYFSVSSPDELEKHLEKCEGETSSIVFFPATEKERNYLFDRYSKFNINRIIFSHQDVGVAETNFSYIMSDFYGDMQLAISHLRDKGCKKIALFNANPHSYHDRMRIETYKKLIFHEPLVFTTDNKIYPTVEQLMKCDERIDAILCINDFVAFCLMLILSSWDKDWSEKLLILSFSDSIVSSLCSPSLSSISFNYTDGGKEVATIHRALEKNDRLAYMHMVMKSQLAKRETTNLENPSGMVFSDYGEYDFEKIKTVIAPQHGCMALEKLLASRDETDLAIMHGLINSSTLAEIGERLYLTRDTIKYRVKKFKETLKMTTTAELSTFLKTWINPSRLEEMIISIKNG
ncbi:MAG: substrate-binding domain-containing protein [Clostridia bacterium]|nr:substrate-binding domain-containing protein [Clostridia bacterium]